MPNVPRPARFVAVLVVALVAFGFYNRYKSSSPHEAPEGLNVVGEIVAITGTVEHRWPSRVEMLPVSKAGGPFHAGELLRTGGGSQVLVGFKNGAQVRVSADSQFVAELDATNTGAIRGTILNGTAEITKPGAPGSLRLFREGRDVTAGRTVAPIVISASETVPAGSQTIVATTTPAAAPTAVPLANQPAGEPPVEETGSLTNDDIRKAFTKNTGFFQRCYLSHLSRKGMSDAHTVTVGFVIEPTGKVNQAKLVRSDFDDATLNNCVVEAIERTSMRPFEGDAIAVLEFPVELN